MFKPDANRIQIQVCSDSQSVLWVSIYNYNNIYFYSANSTIQFSNALNNEYITIIVVLLWHNAAVYFYSIRLLSSLSWL